MRWLILLTLLVVGCTPRLGPAIVARDEIVWADQFGTSGSDQAFALAYWRGLYVAGYTSGDIDGAGPLTFSGGDFDAFVRKYDDAGNVIGTDQFGTTGWDFADALAYGNGGLYVAGRTGGDSDNSDVFVRKYDDAGNVVWTNQFGSSGYTTASALAYGDGGLYVAGWTFGDIDGPGPLTNAGSDGIFVRKYGAAGNVIWTIQFGTPESDIATALAYGDGGLYVAGSTLGDIDGEGPLTFAGGEDYDVFVRKYDDAGNVIWTDQFGTADDLDSAEDLAYGDGGLYVAGSTSGDIDGPGPLTNVGFFDVFVRKYDDAGNVIWTDQFGNSNEVALALAYGDGLYVAGFTQGDIDGPGPLIFAGLDDVFLRRYDDAGNVIWTDQFGTAGSDSAYALAYGGGLYVTGHTGPLGGDDVFVLKYLDAGK